MQIQWRSLRITVGQKDLVENKFRQQLFLIIRARIPIYITWVELRYLIWWSTISGWNIFWSSLSNSLSILSVNKHRLRLVFGSQIPLQRYLWNPLPYKLMRSFVWPVSAANMIFSSNTFLSRLAIMMTLSNGNLFRVAGHLCGEFTGQRWISRTKASDAELLAFLWSALEPAVQTRWRPRWFETSSFSLWRHCNNRVVVCDDCANLESARLIPRPMLSSTSSYVAVQEQFYRH